MSAEQATTTPQFKDSPGVLARVPGILPGLLLCIALAGVSYAIASWPALNEVVPLSALTVGILVGVLLRLCVPLPARVEPGIRWTLHYLLRAGIILLGFRIVLQDMLSVGFGGLALVVVAVTTTILLAVVLGRALKLPDTLSLLVGCGTGICGASAVVAVDGVIKGREQDVACAIAMVTVFGTISMFAYPAIAHAIGLSEAVYATWAGSSIHEVAQAVAAGFAFDQNAGLDASLFKLSRVAMLAPVCAVLAVWWRRRARQDGDGDAAGRSSAPFPLFVLLFVVMVGVNSFVPMHETTRTTLTTIDSALLAAAMVAMGLQTRLVSVARLGWRPLFLGAAITLWISALALSGGLLLHG
ncbi:YeiH family protein [Salinisphaera sp. T31B1]|uniref:YeiH family protein n=1 Tax=Salinisphaera sp. T31B1 TaxID=727963 RepID=UPI00334272B4